MTSTPIIKSALPLVNGSLPRSATAGAIAIAAERTKARDQQDVLCDDHHHHVRAPIADRSKQRAPSSARAHCEAGRWRARTCQAESQSAERLKRREVGVFHSVELRQPFGSSSHRAPRSDMPSSSVAQASRRFVTCLYEQDLVALLLREQRHERLLRHQQLALEDAVAQCGDEAQESPDRHAAARCRHQASCAARRSSSWHPRSLGSRRRASASRAAAMDSRARRLSSPSCSNANRPFRRKRARRGDSRIPRLIQIQAAGIVS